MTDGVIKSTGNSRYLKSVANFMSLYPTYEDFVAALVAGTLPVDLNGINPNGWSTQGTPLNKANLLAGSTSAELGNAQTVNSALLLIGKYNQYWWWRTSVSKATSTRITLPTNNYVSYSDSIRAASGNVTLAGPTSLFVNGNNPASQLDVLTGKYIYNEGSVYFCDGSPSVSGSGSSAIFKVSASKISVGTSAYVQANAKSTYPEDGLSGDYYYTALGRPFDNAVARTMSFEYTGTGTYGSSGQTVLTFPFRPKLVIVAPWSGGYGLNPANGGGWQESGLFLDTSANPPQQVYVKNSSGDTTFVYYTISGSQLSFYSASNKPYLNGNGARYVGIAFG